MSDATAWAGLWATAPRPDGTPQAQAAGRTHTRVLLAEAERREQTVECLAGLLLDARRVLEGRPR